MNQVSESDESSVCPTCGSRDYSRHGVDRDGVQRWRCKHCRRTSRFYRPGKFRNARLRLDLSKIVNALVALGRGLTVRGTARAVGVKPDTVIKIARVAGFVRRCRTCGNQLTGKRFLFCSDECQGWRRDRGRHLEVESTTLRDGAVNVLRTVHADGCEPYMRLAIEIATEFSEENMDMYLGVVYEAIVDAASVGVCDSRDLRKRAREAVKKHWSEIQTFGAYSLDALKEASGFEYAECT